MLVLTRKVGSSIIINGQIKVQVVQVKGRQVRLGIVAPKEAKVHREEIFNEIQQGTIRPSQLQNRPAYQRDIQPVARAESRNIQQRNIQHRNIQHRDIQHRDIQPRSIQPAGV